MLVWLIHLAEMLVTDPAGRPWRYGMLSEAIAARGHRVVQWAPTFAHYTRKYRAPADAVLSPRPGHDVQLVHAGGYDNNVSLRRIRFQSRIARRFPAIASGREPPDIIVVSMPTPSMCAAALKFGRERGIPVLIDVRDLWPDAIYDLFPRIVRFAGRLILLPMRINNGRLFREAAGVTAISEAYLQWALEYAGRAKRWSDGVFPFGYRAPEVDERRREEARAEWMRRGVTGQEFTCCYFGTMGRQYWLEDVIQAAQRLSKMKFLLCGDGDNRGRYMEQARGMSNVMFPGWVSAEQVDALMTLSHVGLAPYRGGAQMSLPNKPFEYMAGGLPVVSSLEGELKDLLEEHRGGLTYRAGDPDSLAGCLRKLRDDANLTGAMSANARRLYESSFRADRIYTALTIHLEQVVERARGPQRAVPSSRAAFTPL
jgi:glycosyltransferase involved in cell wall biosynthesis